MRKITGQCSNCGSPAHPKGNVFRLMRDYDFDLEFPFKPEAPTRTVKVCNNCNTAHPFHHRMSAQAKRFEATLAELLKDGV